MTGNTWLAPTETENGCNANGTALYYSFIGNGQYYRLHLLEGVANFNLIEKDCQTGRCLLSQKLGSGRNSILIASKMDQEYHLRISAPDSVLFRFALECFDPNTNQSCFDAAPVNVPANTGVTFKVGLAFSLVILVSAYPHAALVLP
ncbi:MAG: hypothetical protein IPP37_20965 [Saprospiraceae bacterium]|nr:hypothetical protein [Saprospiraceae bacterium]